MTRAQFIERILIQYYGGLPEDDSELTFDIVNAWLPDATAMAASQCYIGSIKMDGVSYVNDSFYTTFSGLLIVADDTDNLCYKIELPEIPIGIGRNEGVSEIRFKGDDKYVSKAAIPVDINQWGYMDNMRVPVNKIFFLTEGKFARFKSTKDLTKYNGIIKMISAGDATNLNSELNVPGDYFPVMQEYIFKQLAMQKQTKPDVANDGVDMA
jgi:hypothetical protein